LSYLTNILKFEEFRVDLMVTDLTTDERDSAAAEELERREERGKMKQQDLRGVVLRSAIQVLTAALGSLAVGYLLRRVLTPKTVDSDVKSALKKLHDIEARPAPSLFPSSHPSLIFASNLCAHQSQTQISSNFVDLLKFGFNLVFKNDLK
jgi:hypothetical protein